MRTESTLVEFRGGGEKDVEDANARAEAPPARVAVIEDDERLRQALVFQLGTAGFQVVPYSSAEEFLGISDASSFDCIVVDNFLPKMNGLQLQAQLPGCVVDEVVSFVLVELIVSLFAPVFGSVMPEFTGGLFAPDAAAGPP